MEQTQFPKRSTPVPNVLIDEVMPVLKDTAWRVLCVVVRQTLGWHTPSNKHRKTHDWLSHSQLKARTGRSSEAVSEAVDTLVRQGLLEVRNDTGDVLVSPEARRRTAGRLYYGIAPDGITEPTLDRFVSVATTASLRGAISKSEVSISESEIGKAKTTKETGYKIKHSLPTVPKEADASEVRNLLELHANLFQKSASSTEAGAPTVDDIETAQILVAAYPYKQLVVLLQKFFLSENSWVRASDYSLAAFSSFIPYLLLAERFQRRSAIRE